MKTFDLQQPTRIVGHGLQLLSCGRCVPIRLRGPTSVRGAMLQARVDCKVVLLGSSGVGKTCLLDRYVNDSFEPTPKNTIGAAFAAKKVRADGR